MMMAEDSLDRFYDTLLKYRWRVVLLLLLLMVLPLSGMRLLQFSMDYHVFFGGNDHHLDEFVKQQKIYSQNESVLIAIEPNTNDIFDYKLIKVIQQYTDEAWLLSAVTRVDSLSNFQDITAKGDELITRELVEKDLELSESRLNYIKSVALSDPNLHNRLVSNDGKYTAIALTFLLPDGNGKNEQIIDIVNKVRELASRLEAEGEVRRVYLSGTVMVNNAFYEVSKHDLITLIPVMFLVIIIFMSALIKSLGTTMLVFTKVGFAVGISFGIGSMLGIKLTPPAAAAAPIIMMLSIADSVHLLITYYKYCNHGSDYIERVSAIKKSLQSNFVPITLTSVTTVIGFLTLNFAESPPFHDLGNLVAMGAIAGYLLTMLVLPLFVTLLPVPRPRKERVLENWLRNLSGWVVRNRVALIFSTFSILLVLVYFISRNSLNDEFVKYFDESIKFRTDNDFITQNLTGVYQIEYSLTAKSEYGINEQEYLHTVDRFAEWFRKLPQVIHVQSVSDIYKKANKNLHNGSDTDYRIPESRELAAQAIMVYGMSLPVGLDLNDRISLSSSAAKFVVSLKTISANELIEIETAADNWLKNNAPEYMRNAIGTGPAVLFSHIGVRSIRSGLVGGVVALLLICVLLSIVFRSIRIGLICILPNLFPAAMAFGVWGVINGQINMALATVLSMTLGIIVDDTIHFVSKYKQRIAAGDHPEQAIRSTFTSVGVAIVVTTIVLVAGFSVLTYSPFVMNWGMGLLSSITIIFALITDLLFLPAFLLQFDRQDNIQTLSERATN